MKSLLSTARQKLGQAPKLKKGKLQKLLDTDVQTDRCILTLLAHGGAKFRVPTRSVKLSLVLRVSEDLAIKILFGSSLVDTKVSPWSIPAKDIPSWNESFQVASGLPWHVAINGLTHHFHSHAIVGSITIWTSANNDGAYQPLWMIEEQHLTPNPY